MKIYCNPEAKLKQTKPLKHHVQCLVRNKFSTFHLLRCSGSFSFPLVTFVMVKNVDNQNIVDIKIGAYVAENNYNRAAILHIHTLHFKYISRLI